MKKLIFKKGQQIAFQDMLEVKLGGFLAKNSPYNDNIECKSICRDKNGDGTNIHPDDAYFDFDADYEIIIRKKRNK